MITELDEHKQITKIIANNTNTYGKNVNVSIKKRRLGFNRSRDGANGKRPDGKWMAARAGTIIVCI